jgi:hypothetical protein
MKVREIILVIEHLFSRLFFFRSLAGLFSQPLKKTLIAEIENRFSPNSDSLDAKFGNLPLQKSE